MEQPVQQRLHYPVTAALFGGQGGIGPEMLRVVSQVRVAILAIDLTAAEAGRLEQKTRAVPAIGPEPEALGNCSEVSK